MNAFGRGLVLGAAGAGAAVAIWFALETRRSNDAALAAAPPFCETHTAHRFVVFGQCRPSVADAEIARAGRAACARHGLHGACNVWFWPWGAHLPRSLPMRRVQADAACAVWIGRTGTVQRLTGGC